MHGGDKAGRPAMPLVSCQHEAIWPRPLALAQEASWARTTPPLFEQQQFRLYFLLEHNYSLVTCILHIIWI